jgi:hypothetical protein
VAETKGDHAVKGNLDISGNAKFNKGLDSSYLEVLDAKTSGTAGGTFSPNVWRTRDITSVVFDDFSTSVTTASTPGDGASNIVLPKGAYYTEIDCPAYKVGNHVARLADVTDEPGQFGTTVINGTATSSAAADGVQTVSRIMGKFVLSRTTTLEIQHRCAAEQTTNGWGVDGGFYVTDNHYTVCRMWQLRDDS